MDDTMNDLIKLAALAAFLWPSFAARCEVLPQRVLFPSADGRTMLTGYLFAPAAQRSARAPAVVMMHGRAGAYSVNANGRYDETTLRRPQLAPRLVAPLVDGFGPRGYPQGWSNGGSATLATMATGAPGLTGAGFRAALAFYPACGLKGQFDGSYRPYAPVQVFHGTAAK